VEAEGVERTWDIGLRKCESGRSFFIIERRVVSYVMGDIRDSVIVDDDEYSMREEGIGSPHFTPLVADYITKMADFRNKKF